MARLISALKERPWVFVFALYLASLLLTSPWGNYPLNDDWTYGHIAKRFGETGILKLDTPVVANTVGQTVLVWPVIALFGFSFLTLRLVTMALALAGLWALDRILKLATDRFWLRVAAGVLLAFNPIYFYCSATFLTELYSWIPGLLAAAVWFTSRQARQANEGSVLSWPASIGAGMLTALAFWIRQPGIIIYPALLGATVVHLALSRQWRALTRSAGPLVAGAVVFVLVIAAFFVWAEGSGNFPAQFASRIPNLIRIDSTVWLLTLSAAIAYQTFYFAPLLVLYVVVFRRSRVALLSAAAVLAFAVFGRSMFQALAPNDYGMGLTWIHKSFPYLMNVVFNAGLGPITVSDVFWGKLPGPSWSTERLKLVEYAILLLTPLWGAVVIAVVQNLRRAFRSLTFEVLLFATLLVCGGAVAVIQTHQTETVDRYQLPIILGLALLLPMCISLGQPSVKTNWAAPVCAVLLIPLIAYSVCGLHDHFAWNDARAALIVRARELGASPVTLEAGIEPNCWELAEGNTRDQSSCGPRGCRCAFPSNCCVDDRWRVGMHLLRDYQIVQTLQPSWWLVNGPPLILSRR